MSDRKTLYADKITACSIIISAFLRNIKHSRASSRNTSKKQVFSMILSKFIIAPMLLLLSFSSWSFTRDPDRIAPVKDSKMLVARNLKLVVWDDDGRFNLFAANENKWEPLFFNDVPSTNFIRFYLNNTALDFGKGGRGNRSSISIVDDSIVYEWSNSTVLIKLTYNFIKTDSEFFDTLKMKVSIMNLSRNSIRISALFSFDTYLGENTHAHFTLPGGLSINNETEFTSNSIPSQITSLGINENEKLIFFFDPDRTKRPDRIFMANWKKVSETIGIYQSKQGDSFNWGRFSFNDSALFAEFRDLTIGIEQEISREILIQNKITAVKTEKKETGFASPGEETGKETSSELDLDKLSIAELLKLLTEINKKLDGTSSISQKDIDYADRIINAIEKRR